MGRLDEDPLQLPYYSLGTQFQHRIAAEGASPSQTKGRGMNTLQQDLDVERLWTELRSMKETVNNSLRKIATEIRQSFALYAGLASSLTKQNTRIQSLETARSFASFYNNPRTNILATNTVQQGGLDMREDAESQIQHRIPTILQRVNETTSIPGVGPAGLERMYEAAIREIGVVMERFTSDFPPETHPEEMIRSPLDSSRRNSSSASTLYEDCLPEDMGNQPNTFASHMEHVRDTRYHPSCPFCSEDRF
jgi:hypothetical protein